MSKNNVNFEASKIVAYQGLEKSLILQEKQINADIELRKQIHLDEYVCQKKMIDILSSVFKNLSQKKG